MPEPESESGISPFIYVACAVVALVLTAGVVYVLLDTDEPKSQVAAAPMSDGEVRAEEPEAAADTSSDPPAEPLVEAPAAEPNEEIDLERASKMNGHDWVGLNAKDRLATVKLLAIIITVTDQNVKVEQGALTIDQFLDAFYTNEDNLDTGIYKACDSYMEHLRGFELRASGSGNMTTDAFYFPGDGYLMFKPNGTGGGYSVSIYDDATARIEKANVLMQFQGSLEPQLTRLRMPEGTYYLEINSTVAWEAYVVNTRGMAWLKRRMADDAKREEELKKYQDAAEDGDR